MCIRDRLVRKRVLRTGQEPADDGLFDDGRHQPEQQQKPQRRQRPNGGVEQFDHNAFHPACGDDDLRSAHPVRVPVLPAVFRHGPDGGRGKIVSAAPSLSLIHI